ncbi:MAG: NADH-quinone oxidoreductase subunit L, partial [Opitutales bacterium]
MSPQTALLLTLLAPLATAAGIAFFLRRQGGLAAACSVGAASVLCAGAFIAISARGDGAVTASWEWLSFGEFKVSMGFLFDDVAATMLAMVSFVGLLIHIFSLGYMKTDKSRARFFGGLSIFMFSMTGIVLADNL